MFTFVHDNRVRSSAVEQIPFKDKVLGSPCHATGRPIE